MLIVVKLLVMVPNRLYEVHKARLRALQRYLSSRSDGSTAKASRRIAAEITDYYWV